VFQIAEGGMARVYDILVRLKALASQAGSSQLSSTERGMLDTEYQAMVDEIDRLAANTTFNGNTLINKNVTVTRAGAGVFNSNNASVLDFAAAVQTGTGDATVGFNFASASGNRQITASANGLTYQGTIAANLLNSSGQLISGTAIRLVATDGSGNAATGNNANNYISVTFNSGVDVTTALGADNSVTVGGGSTTTFAFKVGTSGISANDEISLNVRGMNTKSLGINNSNITTVVRSDAASAAVTEAINVLLNARSEVGAVQNRLESAQNNINTILENIEAARSAYLDLDIAAEMATFTSKQILVQAGVSMLAEANKVPQNLLRLFQ